MEPVTYDLPMRVQFRGLERRRGMVWRGTAGWGEFSPFEEYAVAECRPWFRAAVEAAERGFPVAVRRFVPVNVTVPAVSAGTAERIVDESCGCMTAKVKVAELGQGLDQDLARVAAVRAVLGPAGRIRVDANGAWAVDQANDHLARLDQAAGGLEYAEQPCRTVQELAELRRLTKVPIAADESIRQAEDPLLVKRLAAADVIVLKVQPLGGVRACLELADQVGLPVVVSSAVETVVGIAMGLALAGALPHLELACGLATGQLLAADLAKEAFPVVGGQIELAPAKVDLGLLAKAEAGMADQMRWQDRLAAVAQSDTEASEVGSVGAGYSLEAGLAETSLEVEQ